MSILFDGGGGRQGDESILILECNQGKPVPVVLHQYLHEPSFRRMMEQCDRARTREEFENIVISFNSQFGIDGAIQAIEVGHPWLEVIGSTLFAPIGMTFGMGWKGFKSPRNRYLRVDTNILMQVQHAFPSADVRHGNTPRSTTVRAQATVVGQEGVPVVKATVSNPSIL
jgi:hypothetical protein